MSRSARSNTPRLEEANRPLSPAPVAAELPLGHIQSEKLWLGLTFLDLPLAALAVANTHPAAVVEVQGNEKRLIALNDKARSAGLIPGLKLNGALALVPDLELHERQPQRESELLDNMAAWATRFTPASSIVPEDGLVLEIGGSLRMFGGRAAFKKQFHRRLLEFGIGYRCALAPTPLAALWLSRGSATDVISVSELSGRLGSLPLSVLRWPEQIQSLLEQMGLTTLADCLRLPREGLMRRIGVSYLQELDRALGKQYDPRKYYRPKQRFVSIIELDEETHDRKQLASVGERLLSELAVKLRQHQQAVDRLTFEFCHLNSAATPMQLTLLEPSHEFERFITLFQDRLERCAIERPVISLKLLTGRATSLKPSSGMLPLAGKEHHRGGDKNLLIERLRARFGVEAVYGLCLVDEHRPEAAWNRVTEAYSRPAVGYTLRGNRRPLWMLSRPVPLVVTVEGPCYEGQLVLEQGPERIETGWWDGADVCRDYYIARSDAGARMWVFQERRRKRGWYLHGIFS